jgi:M3 family oligoendopeptidase
VAAFEAASVSAEYADLRNLIASHAGDRPIEVFKQWENLRRSVAAWRARVHLEMRQDAFNEVAAANGRSVAEALPLYEAHDAALKSFFLAPERRLSIPGVVGAATLARWEADAMAFAPIIQDDLRLEATLTNEYFQLIGKMKTALRGREYTLTGLAVFAEDGDRSLRRDACFAGWNAVGECSATLDALFDDLVRCRTSMARKLGDASYIPLAYKRLGRADYGPVQVALFRDEIAESIVPLAETFARDQVGALGIGALMPWDEGLQDRLPMPRPPATSQELVRSLRSAAAAVHPTFEEFLLRMIYGGTMDLSDRPGKAGGAFCTFLSDQAMPFVFANYTGSARNVGSIVHELGHAFQNYQSRHHPALEQIIPTSEIGEIHSIALELLARPVYEKLFKGDSQRYLSHQLRSLIGMLPYIAAIDHFQELVYREPTATSLDRCEMWLGIERRYLPWRGTGGIAALEKGARRQRQRHVYAFPFYYIDYGLAICCALQLWLQSLNDRNAAIEQWLSLCSLGGTLGFEALLEQVAISSPFKPGTLTRVVAEAQRAT